MAALLARLNPLSSLIETFCEIPGARYIAPLFLGLFNIPALISSFIPILMIVMFASNANILNSTDNKNKSWATAAEWSFLIYYILITIVMYSTVLSTCNFLD